VIYLDSRNFGEEPRPEDQDFDNFVESIAVPTISACINKLVALTAAVPIKQVDRVTEEDLKRPALTNALGEDLLSRPNPGEGGAYFRQKLYQHFALTGNLYVYAFPTIQDPTELWCLESDKMSPRLSTSNQYPFESFVYKGSRRKELIDAANVVFVRRPNPKEPIYGLSFIYQCLQAVKTLYYSRRLTDSIMKRGGRTGGILNIKGQISDDEFNRVTKSIQSRMSLEGAGRVAVIVSEDAEFTADTQSPRDLEHSDARSEAKNEIYNVFGFMPALFATKDVNRSNLREAKASAYEDCVMPFLNLILEGLNGSAMTIAKGMKFKAEWAAVPSLQPNKLEMARAADVLLKHTVATPNEIAALFGLERKEWGDEPARPAAPAAPEPAEDMEEEEAMAANGNGNGEEERALRELDVRELRALLRQGVS
jgi:HK97 family phage portal protein